MSDASSAQRSARDRLLLVHGIQSRGRWYRGVRDVMEQFFSCRPVRYRHYRVLGFLKVALEPWVLVAGVALTEGHAVCRLRALVR